MRYLVAAALAAGLLATPAVADAWKDESGHSRRGYDRDYRAYNMERDRDGYREHRARIPRGHLPPPGSCRTWHPGVPAGHQPPPYRC